MDYSKLTTGSVFDFTNSVTHEWEPKKRHVKTDSVGWDSACSVDSRLGFAVAF
jgi:hypothetical protein